MPEIPTNIPCPRAIQPQSGHCEIGSLAPDFSLPTIDGHIGLSELRGQPVVLVFAPSGWNPSLHHQLARYNEIAAEIAPPNAQVLGIAMHDIWCDLEFADAEHLRFPLLRDSDPRGDVARAYGTDGKHAVFVIDENGIIRWKHVLPIGIAPDAARLRSALAESYGQAHAPLNMTRRQFVAAAMAAALVLATGNLLPPAEARPAPQAQHGNTNSGEVPVTLRINGETHHLNLEPRVTLLDALREYIGLTGSKKGCDHGQCGACTVLVNGRRVLSCLSLAIAQQGSEITTIEGLAHGEELHPLQAAFIEHDGFQCGYCTSGQIMSAVGLLNEGHAATDDEIREQMSGNICRCGAYPNIRAAIRAVRGQA